MLGDQIGSMESATVNKTLTADGALPKFEVSATGAGQLCGVDVTSIATYIAQMRSDGSLYGECPNAGVVMAADGVATFRASGASSFTEDGGSKFRGVVYFETAAPSLSSLNGMWMRVAPRLGSFGSGSSALSTLQIIRCDRLPVETEAPLRRGFFSPNSMARV